jgi:hypothetical protein
VGVLLSCTVGAAIWGLDKGLDLLDEGFYLLASTSPQDYPFISSFHFYMARMPHLLDNAVCNYRLLFLLMQLTSSQILAFGVIKWLKNHAGHLALTKQQALTMHLLSAMAAMESFSILPAITGYNGISSFFILSSFGLLLFAQASKFGGKAILSSTATAGAGILIALSFFAKFSAFSFCIICALVLISTESQTLHKKALTALAYLAGVLGGFFVFFLGIEPFAAWQSTFFQLLEIEMNHGPHSANSILSSSLTSAGKHAAEIFLVLLAVSILIALAKFKRPPHVETNKRWALALPIAVAVLLAIFWLKALSFDWIAHSSICYWPFLFVFLTVLCAIVLAARSASSLKSVLLGMSPVLITLCVLPLFMSIGTNSPLLWHALSNFSPLTLCAFILALIAADWLESAIYAPLVALAMAGTMSVQFFNGFLLNHKNYGSIFTQTVMMESPERMRGLRLDRDCADFIVQTQKILTSNGFQPGDAVLGIYDLPGLVYAIEGRSPGIAWYASTPESSTIMNQYWLSRLGKSASERLFMIVVNPHGNPTLDEKLIPSLKKSGLDCTEDFVQIGCFEPQTPRLGIPAYYYRRR